MVNCISKFVQEWIAVVVSLQLTFSMNALTPILVCVRKKLLISKLNSCSFVQYRFNLLERTQSRDSLLHGVGSAHCIFSVYHYCRRISWRWSIDGFEISNCCCGDLDYFVFRYGNEVVGYWIRRAAWMSPLKVNQPMIPVEGRRQIWRQSRQQILAWPLKRPLDDQRSEVLSSPWWLHW